MAEDVITPAADRMSAALSAIPGVRHYRQRYGLVQPPATVLALSSAAWNGPDPEPTDATWAVGLVVDRNERSEERLWPLLAAVSEALDGLDSVVVFRDVRQDTYPSGGTDLPALIVTVDVCL